MQVGAHQQQVPDVQEHLAPGALCYVPLNSIDAVPRATSVYDMTQPCASVSSCALAGNRTRNVLCYRRPSTVRAVRTPRAFVPCAARRFWTPRITNRAHRDRGMLGDGSACATQHVCTSMQHLQPAGSMNVDLTPTLC